MNFNKFIKIRLTIEENGVGIKDASKLFSDYATLEEHRDMNLNGTGLGL